MADYTGGDFIPMQGGYRKLKAFQLATCIYDVTYYFANKYFDKKDRTVDQMIQAARSGKQNIAEGSAASTTSSETEIKLTNVAKASLQELLLDYEDYIRVNGLEQWAATDSRTVKTRLVCRSHSDSKYYMDAVKVRSAETVANIAIVLIHQTDYLLERLIERQKQNFLRNGGIREQMTRARLEERNKRR